MSKALEFNSCVPGGGACETALNIYLEDFARSLGSREQLAVAESALGASETGARPHLADGGHGVPKPRLPTRGHRAPMWLPCLCRNPQKSAPNRSERVFHT